jgi:hypothetical protein
MSKLHQTYFNSSNDFVSSSLYFFNFKFSYIKLGIEVDSTRFNEVLLSGIEAFNALDVDCKTNSGELFIYNFSRRSLPKFKSEFVGFRLIPISNPLYINTLYTYDLF